MDNTNTSSFWQFSDQLRNQTSNLNNLSLNTNNDSIWSTNNINSNFNSYVNVRSNVKSSNPTERRNFDVNVRSNEESNQTIWDGHSNNTVNGFSSFKNLDAKNEISIWRNDAKNKLTSGLEAKNVNLLPESVFDARVGGDRKNNNNNNNVVYTKNYNGFNSGWKLESDLGFNNHKNYNNNNVVNATVNGVPSSGSFLLRDKDIYGNKNYNFYKNGSSSNVVNGVNNGGGVVENEGLDVATGKKKGKNEKSGKSNGEKKFKTLPPSESLPREETIGGYIFVCNNDTMQENLQRELWGLPPRYRDSVRAIRPGLPLFLYNYSTHQLHGVFEASSFGGVNIDPTAWEDKKCAGESRFPAQVRAITRKLCEPLEEDSFRPILHHYDGPKFRLELNIPEALELLDKFAENKS